jgi:hypothetical protein
MAAVLLSYIRVANNALYGTRYNYSDEEKASGQHCIDLFKSDSDSPLSIALNKRLGNRIDPRTHVILTDVLLEPLETDGTHEMIALYQVVRIGQRVLPERKAIGIVTNADCSFRLTVVQR